MFELADLQNLAKYLTQGCHNLRRAMTDDPQRSQDAETLPQDFVRLVKDALEHLYDFPHLQCHPLIQNDDTPATRSDKTAGQQLRAEIMTAIETLNPGPEVSFRSPHTRPYSLLQLRYIEDMTVSEAAHELGVSERQAYRDLRRGERGVASVLWARRANSSSSSVGKATALSSLQAEMARLEPKPRSTDIYSLLQQAQQAVEQLAVRHAVHLQIETRQPVFIVTDPDMALQILINMLSHTIQQAQPGPVNIELTSEGSSVFLTLHYVPQNRATAPPIADRVAETLADQLSWMVEWKDQSDGARRVRLTLAAKGPTILVIDDNKGLVELLDRYLTGHACQVLAASSGQEGLDLARELLPSAIILDVMMPGMDGWEILQRLRAHPPTADTPVIICSVFNDPELAYSLGASFFLPKPVRRDAVLAALRQLGVA